MLTKGLELILSGLNKIIKWIFTLINGGLKNDLETIESIFIIIAILGMFFVMFGKRDIGTKCTSLSILGYIIIKVVM